MAIEKWVIQPGQTKVIDLEVVRSLKVSLIGGTVNVIAHDEPGARVEVNSVTRQGAQGRDRRRPPRDRPPAAALGQLDRRVQGLPGSAKAEVSDPRRRATSRSSSAS